LEGEMRQTMVILSAMKKISILVPESSVIQAIADPQYCFSAVNQYYQSQGKPAPFLIELVGFKKEVSLGDGNYSVFPDQLIEEVRRTDLIFVPALFGNLEQAVQLNQAFIPWIREQYDRGAEVASLCVGAFLLAGTGLLDGKKCSTHWGFTKTFRDMYEAVDVQEGKIVTEENRIYSSGGANSYWNLLLHLVEKYTDRQTAIYISKYFAIDINRNSQSPFAMFKGQKDHPDEAVIDAQEFIEDNYNEKITVDMLADRAAVGRRSFERRFRKATSNAVLEYIQRVKIEAAKRVLESSTKNVNEVMFDVGYTDTKAFRTVFKKITGLTPMEYRNRYNKLATM